MVKNIADIKIYEPDYIKENDFPESVVWEEVIDKPTTLAELSPTDGAALDAASLAIDGLGALAYEDLVTELQLAANAVTNAKIAVDAIQGAVIAAGAITVTKIGDGAIETAKLAAGAITAAKIAAGTITANEIAASTITAGKMNVSTLSSITANVGTLTAGSINGLTITGGTIRTASSGTRVQLDESTNEIQIYNGSTKRARGYQQGWDYYNSSAVLKASLYVSGDDFLLAADITSTGNMYYGVGSSGSHSFHVGTGASTMRMYIDDDELWLGDVDNFNFEIECFGILKTYNVARMMGAGSVSSGGTLSGGGTGWSANNDSTGVYTVTHGLGTTGYAVVVTGNVSSTREVVVSSKGSNSFTVRIYNNATASLTNAAFEFLLIRHAP